MLKTRATCRWVTSAESRSRPGSWRRRSLSARPGRFGGLWHGPASPAPALAEAAGAASFRVPLPKRQNFVSPPAMGTHMRAPVQADATSDRHSSFTERPIKAGKLLRGYHATCALTHRQADRMSSTASQAGENDQTNASKVPNSDRNQ